MDDSPDRLIAQALVRRAVFLSSTVDDLIDARALVRQQLHQHGYRPIACELSTFPLPPGLDTAGASRQAVASCDYFILIVGPRRGQEIPERGLTYTELEFHTATELQKPIIAFCQENVWHAWQTWRLNRGQPVNYPFISAADADPIFRFLERIEALPEQRRRWFVRFENAVDLAESTVHQVNSEQARIGSTGLSPDLLREVLRELTGATVDDTQLERLAVELPDLGYPAIGSVVNAFQRIERTALTSTESILRSLRVVTATMNRTPLQILLPEDPALPRQPPEALAELDRLRSAISDITPHDMRIEERVKVMQDLVDNLILQQRLAGGSGFGLASAGPLAQYLWREYVQDEGKFQVDLIRADTRRVRFWCTDTAFDKLNIDVWQSDDYHRLLLETTRFLARKTFGRGEVIRIAVLSEPKSLLQLHGWPAVVAFCKSHLECGAKVGFARRSNLPSRLSNDLADFFLIPGRVLYRILDRRHSIHQVYTPHDDAGRVLLDEYESAFQELRLHASILETLPDLGRLEGILRAL